MKLVSVNIEGQKHLDTVREFLAKENPDVVCLQECFPETIEEMTKGQWPYKLFVPTYKVDQDDQELKYSATRKWGEAILSKLPMTDEMVLRVTMETYGPDNLPGHGIDNHLPTVLLATIGEIRIGTTHLTWTPGASVTDRQRAHVAELLEMTRGKELVLCGDFNIPRGNEMYRKLTTYYLDNVPMDIETTIDPMLHYVNKRQQEKLKLVVDYAWSTPKYKVKNVRVVCGVSDHCAVVSEIELVSC